MKTIIIILILTTATLYSEYWNQFDNSKPTYEQRLERNEKQIANKQKVDEFNHLQETDWNFSWHDNLKYIKRATRNIDPINLQDSLNIPNYFEGFLQSLLPFIGLSRSELIIDEVKEFPKSEIYTIIYKQIVDGITFDIFGELVITLKKGKLSVGNTCYVNFEINTKPIIIKDRAWNIVKTNFQDYDKFFVNNKHIREGYTENDYFEKTKLVIHTLRYRDSQTGLQNYTGWKLAYKVILPTYDYYIDALNGTILHAYNTEIN